MLLLRYMNDVYTFVALFVLDIKDKQHNCTTEMLYFTSHDKLTINYRHYEVFNDFGFMLFVQ